MQVRRCINMHAKTARATCAKAGRHPTACAPFSDMPRKTLTCRRLRTQHHLTCPRNATEKHFRPCQTGHYGPPHYPYHPTGRPRPLPERASFATTNALRGMGDDTFMPRETAWRTPPAHRPRFLSVKIFYHRDCIFMQTYFRKPNICITQIGFRTKKLIT